MRRNGLRVRWTSAEGLVLAAFIAVLAWAPFPYGSNRLWAELALGLALGCVLFAWSAAVMLGRANVTAFTKRLVLAALCAALALGWAWIQAADLAAIERLFGWQTAALAHPLWAMSAEALGAPAGAYPALAPELARQAIFAALTGVAAFVLAFELGRDGAQALRLTGALVVIAVVYAALAMASAFLELDFQAWAMPDAKPDTGRVAGPFVNPNHFATFAALGALAALALGIERVREAVVWDRGARTLTRTLIDALTGPNALWLAATVALLTVLLLSQSRGGVIALAAGVIALFMALAFRPSTERDEAQGAHGYVALFAVLIVAAAWIGGEPLLARLHQQGIGDSERASLAASTIGAAEAAPLAGHGFGAFQRYYPMFADGSVAGDVDEAHNDVLETLADLGLPAGTVFFAAPLLIALTCLGGCLRRRRDRAFPAVGFAATVTVGTHAFLDFSLQIPAVAVTYAALLGVGAAQAWSSQSEARSYGVT